MFDLDVRNDHGITTMRNNASNALWFVFFLFFFLDTGSQALWCVVFRSPVSNLVGRQVQECGTRMKFRSIQGWLRRPFFSSNKCNLPNGTWCHNVFLDENCKNNNTKLQLIFTHIWQIIVFILLCPHLLVFVVLTLTSEVGEFTPKLYVLSHS